MVGEALERRHLGGMYHQRGWGFSEVTGRVGVRLVVPGRGMVLDDLLWLGGLRRWCLLARRWVWWLLAGWRWWLLDMRGERQGLHVHRPWRGLVWLGGRRLRLGGWRRLELLHRGVWWGWQGGWGLGLHLHRRE